MHVYADAIRACSAKPKEDEEDERVEGERRRGKGDGGGDGSCGGSGVEGSGAQGDGTAAGEPGSGAIAIGGWTGSHDGGSALRRALGLFDEVGATAAAKVVGLDAPDRLLLKVVHDISKERLPRPPCGGGPLGAYC